MVSARESWLVRRMLVYRGAGLDRFHCTYTVRMHGEKKPYWADTA